MHLVKNMNRQELETEHIQISMALLVDNHEYLKKEYKTVEQAKERLRQLEYVLNYKMEEGKLK